VPLAVTATRSLELPTQVPLFQDPESRIVVLTSSEREAPVAPAQVTVERVATGADLDLVRAMETLRRTHGVHTLLLEGGPTLLGAMLEAGVVDELFLAVASLIVDGGPEDGIVASAAPPQPLALAWI